MRRCGVLCPGERAGRDGGGGRPELPWVTVQAEASLPHSQWRSQAEGRITKGGTFEIKSSKPLNLQERNLALRRDLSWCLRLPCLLLKHPPSHLSSPSSKISVVSSITSICPSVCHIRGFPSGASGKETTCQCRKCKRQGFDPRVPWSRA